MTIIDPGHLFALNKLDNDGTGRFYELLRFVKREGPGYPGNVGQYPGTTLQECWRAEIARLKYLDNQIHDDCNWKAIYNLRDNIFMLEARAANRHRRKLIIDCREIPMEEHPVCPKCLHIGCQEAGGHA